METIAVFGAGIEATALISGLLESKQTTREALLHVGGPAPAEHNPPKEPATPCSPTDPRLANAATFIFTGSPRTIEALEPTTVQWTQGKQVASAVPGLTIRSLKHRLPGAAGIARFACSGSVRYARGVSVHTRSTTAGDGEVVTIAGILGALGRCFELLEEEIDTAATLLHASGPLLYELAAAVVDSATANGLDPLLAHELTTHSLYGAGTLLEASRLSPEVLLGRTGNDNPEGTEALKCLEQRGYRQLIRRALNAAAERRAKPSARRRTG